MSEWGVDARKGKAHTARSPPNAPETVAAEKKMAERRPNSERLYQLNGIVRGAVCEVSG